MEKCHNNWNFGVDDENIPKNTMMSHIIHLFHFYFHHIESKKQKITGDKNKRLISANINYNLQLIDVCPAVRSALMRQESHTLPSAWKANLIIFNKYYGKSSRVFLKCGVPEKGKNHVEKNWS